MNRRWSVALVIVMLAALAPSAALADDPACTVIGTDGRDVWTAVTDGSQDSDPVTIDLDAVVCGRDGNDYIHTPGRAFSGTFYGGDGIDAVYTVFSGGTFYGGDGGDNIIRNQGGTFYGGDDDDFVGFNDGTFYGGDGDDFVGSGSDPIEQ